MTGLIEFALKKFPNSTITINGDDPAELFNLYSDIKDLDGTGSLAAVTPISTKQEAEAVALGAEKVPYEEQLELPMQVAKEPAKPAKPAELQDVEKDIPVGPEDFEGVRKRRDIVRMMFAKGITDLEDIVNVCETLKSEVKILGLLGDIPSAVKAAFDAVVAENEAD